MCENSGFNTAEKSISRVENRSAGSVQNAAQKQRERENVEDRCKGHGGWEGKAQ